MTTRGEKAMRSYWDEAARTNAVWYVDTSLDFDAPDMERFLETGRVIVKEALDAQDLAPPGRALAVEIGCGVGRVCRALSERFDRVIGLDISPEMIRRARELVPDDRVSFEIGDGSSMGPVADSSADLVLSFTVFQHIPEVSVIEGYIREAGRVLRTGGLVVFQWNNTPGATWWKARRGLLAFLHRMGIGRERYGRNAPQFLGSRVPLERIRAALESGGMELKATNGLGTLFAWAWAVKRP